MYFLPEPHGQGSLRPTLPHVVGSFGLTARAVPFPEGLTEYGWEDIVFGMELKKRGIGLAYEPSARALHCHRITLDDSLKRMRAIGRGRMPPRACRQIPEGKPSDPWLVSSRVRVITP